MRRLVLGLIVFAVVAAGCLGADPLEDDGLPEAQPERPAGEEPAIRGTVASDQFLPLPGAQLLLYTQDRSKVLEETRAGEDGAFAFYDLAPGVYAVQARADGYRTEILGARVEPGTSAKVDFRLRLAPTLDPFVIEHDIVGLLNWAYWYQIEVAGQGCQYPSLSVPAPDPIGPVNASAASCGGTRGAYSVNFRGTLEEIDNETKTILAEVAWRPAGVLGEYLQLIMFCEEGTLGTSGGDREHPCYRVAPQMTSPIALRYDESDWLEDEYDPVGLWQWHIHSGYGMLGTYPLVGVDVGVAYEQSYTIYISIFQRASAPADFSRIPEG